MKASIDADTGVLTVQIDLRDEPEPSSTGNTFSFGYEQARNVVTWKGKPLTVQINAYHKPPKLNSGASAPVRGPMQVVHVIGGPKGGSLCAIPAALQPSTVDLATWRRLPAGVGCAVCADRVAEQETANA